LTRIGVLALQGDFAEHIGVLKALGVDCLEVRLSKDLDGIDGLIIPGGESTTMVHIMKAFDMTAKLKSMIRQGVPTWGTCAGMIVLARELTDSRPEPLGMIDIKVKRNAYGSQIDSFEADIYPTLWPDDPFRAVFIRAPAMEDIGAGVIPLAYLGYDNVVAAREANVLVTSFHPELTKDDRFHSYFIDMISGGQ